MESTLRHIAELVALTVELIAILTVAIGAIEAVFGLARALRIGHQGFGRRKRVWGGFAVWLVLALEFELGADIVRTAITPNWRDIGQLGAIALIRTFLNFFLARDVEGYEIPRASDEAAQVISRPEQISSK